MKYINVYNYLIAGGCFQSRFICPFVPPEMMIPLDM